MGEENWFRAVAYGDIKALRKSIEHGQHVNIQNKMSWTALMLAVLRGKSQIVKLLLHFNASINIQSQFGETALVIAAGHNRPQCFKLLLEAGSNPSDLKEIRYTKVQQVLNNFEKQLISQLYHFFISDLAKCIVKFMI